MLCMIARPNYETEIPLFSDIMDSEKPDNKMTTDEIFDHVMNRLDEYAEKVD